MLIPLQLPPLGNKCELSIQESTALVIPILYHWLQHRSSIHLLNTILPGPPKQQSSVYSLVNPTSLSISTSISTLGRTVLLEKISVILKLRKTMMALDMVADEQLWQVLRQAWIVLVGALGIQESARRCGIAQ